MAATDARPVPRKNAAFRFYFAIRKNDGTLITTWTGQDSEVSLDGAAFSDCTNEATEIGTSGTGYIDLTASEMNADCVVLKITVTNTGALPLVFTLFPEEAGDYRADAVMISGDSVAADNMEAAADGTGYNLGNGQIVSASVTGAVGSVTGNVGGNVTGSIGSLAAQAKADVNAEVLDVLNVDTFSELSSPPAATATFRQMLQYAFMWFRNKSTQTSTQRKLYADDGTTVVATESTSDDGTTYTKGEGA